MKRLRGKTCEGRSKSLTGLRHGNTHHYSFNRRGAERTDIVLPGRQRHSIMLNIILDTSGSMTSDIPLALGAIADFCEATGIDDIRIVQCDTAVTSAQPGICAPEGREQKWVRGGKSREPIGLYDPPPRGTPGTQHLRPNVCRPYTTIVAKLQTFEK